MRPTPRPIVLFVMLLLAHRPGAAEPFVVNANAGNSNFSAIFDSAVGERIVAVSSAVGCELDYDGATGSVSGRCSVALASISVDADTTKSGHFHEWATNGKSKAEACRFETTVSGLKLPKPLVAKEPQAFAAELPFTLCGRGRTDKAGEKVTGTVVLYPPGEYGTTATLRLRARIETFDREAYQVGPAWTGGWLARVQQLAPVVAAKGSIDLNLFARPK